MLSEVSDSVLQHFKEIREKTGIPISAQLRMLENGYKIVKTDDE